MQLACQSGVKTTRSIGAQTIGTIRWLMSDSVGEHYRAPRPAERESVLKPSGPIERVGTASIGAHYLGPGVGINVCGKAGGERAWQVGPRAVNV